MQCFKTCSLISLLILNKNHPNASLCTHDIRVVNKPFSGKALMRTQYYITRSLDYSCVPTFQKPFDTGFLLLKAKSPQIQWLKATHTAYRTVSIDPKSGQHLSGLCSEFSPGGNPDATCGNQLPVLKIINSPTSQAPFLLLFIA